MGVVVVEDLDVDRSCSVPPAPAADPEQGSLPVTRLLGLVGSAGFAFWTSLTCFVC